MSEGTGALARRIAQIWGNVEYRRMVDPEDRAAAYRLRYEGYLREGKIEPHPSRMLSDAYDELPNTDTYGIYICGRLVSTLRMCVVTPECPKSPSVTAFGDALLDRVREGKIIIDPQRLVIDPRAVGQFPELPWLMVRLPTMACIHFGADEGLSSVQTRHKGFYERIFRTERIGVGSGAVATEPGMSGALDAPEFRTIGRDPARPTTRAALAGGRNAAFRDERIGVGGSHGRIARAVQDDHRRALPLNGRRAAAHGCEGRWHVVRRPCR